MVSSENIPVRNHSYAVFLIYKILTARERENEREREKEKSSEPAYFPLEKHNTKSKRQYEGNILKL